MKMPWLFWVLLSGAIVSLSSCGMLEKVWLVPEVRSEVPFDTKLINKQVLDAVAMAVTNVNVTFWSRDITYLDVLEGTLETGYFRTPNIAAAQLRIEIDRDSKVIVLTVKGAGPYYSKLPVEECHRLFRAALLRKLSEVENSRKVLMTRPRRTVAGMPD